MGQQQQQLSWVHLVEAHNPKEGKQPNHGQQCRSLHPSDS